ncbi:MAG: hypothetical protein RLZZ156_1519 [Deinococcota bacterium]|jgi:hypothetical protein
MKKVKLLSFIILLSGCVGYAPTPIDFATDQRILRGIWKSQADSKENIQLNLSASYIDTSNYSISGTIELNSNAGLSIVGIVEGFDTHNYIRPQTSMPLLSVAKLKYILGGVNYNLHCTITRLNSAKPMIPCSVNKADAYSDTEPFTLQKQ